jgi:hypothetical protein
MVPKEARNNACLHSTTAISAPVRNSIHVPSCTAVFAHRHMWFHDNRMHNRTQGRSKSTRIIHGTDLRGAWCCCTACPGTTRAGRLSSRPGTVHGQTETMGMCRHLIIYLYSKNESLSPCSQHGRYRHCTFMHIMTFPEQCRTTLRFSSTFAGGSRLQQGNEEEKLISLIRFALTARMSGIHPAAKPL